MIPNYCSRDHYCSQKLIWLHSWLHLYLIFIYINVVYFDQLLGARWSNYFFQPFSTFLQFLTFSVYEGKNTFFCLFSDVFCWFQAWNHWKRFIMNKKGWKRLKKVAHNTLSLLAKSKSLFKKNLFIVKLIRSSDLLCAIASWPPKKCDLLKYRSRGRFKWIRDSQLYRGWEHQTKKLK